MRTENPFASMCIKKAFVNGPRGTFTNVDNLNHSMGK